MSEWIATTTASVVVVVLFTIYISLKYLNFYVVFHSKFEGYILGIKKRINYSKTVDFYKLKSTVNNMYIKGVIIFL